VSSFRSQVWQEAETIFPSCLGFFVWSSAGRFRRMPLCSNFEPRLVGIEVFRLQHLGNALAKLLLCV
jgi:hypothetical protein